MINSRDRRSVHFWGPLSRGEIGEVGAGGMRTGVKEGVMNKVSKSGEVRRSWGDLAVAALK